jgi:hypothetical protein
MNDPIISRVRFADGTEREVFEQLDGRQYVLDDGGEPSFAQLFQVYGSQVVFAGGHLHLTHGSLGVGVAPLQAVRVVILPPRPGWQRPSND